MSTRITLLDLPCAVLHYMTQEFLSSKRAVRFALTCTKMNEILKQHLKYREQQNLRVFAHQKFWFRRGFSMLNWLIDILLAQNAYTILPSRDQARKMVSDFKKNHKNFVNSWAFSPYQRRLRASKSGLLSDLERMFEKIERLTEKLRVFPA